MNEKIKIKDKNDKGNGNGLSNGQNNEKETREERIVRESKERGNAEKEAKKNAETLKLQLKNTILQQLQTKIVTKKEQVIKVKDEKEKNQQQITIGVNKVADIVQKKFQIQLKQNEIEKFIKKNQEEKNINSGKRYGVIVIEVDKEAFNNDYYIISTFSNDADAVLFFRRQIRNKLLKSYSSVKCIVKCLSDKSTTNEPRIVCSFSEDRMGKQQRMLHFLRRDVFNDYNFQLSR